MIRPPAQRGPGRPPKVEIEAKRDAEAATKAVIRSIDMGGKMIFGVPMLEVEQEMIAEPLGRMMERLDETTLARIGAISDPVLLASALIAYMSRVLRTVRERGEDDEGGSKPTDTPPPPPEPSQRKPEPEKEADKLPAGDNGRGAQELGDLTASLIPAGVREQFQTPPT